MSDTLQGKTIIVTGASQGIGESAARLFAEQGAQLILASRNVESGEALVRELTEAGAAARFVKCDVAVEDNVRAVVETAIQTFGRIDGAFNNAGVNSVGKKLHELEEAEFRRAIDVDLVGLFLCMKHQIREMLKTGGGSIVISGSVASVIGLERSADYNTAKHGVLGLMRSAVADYGKDNIRVNTLVIGPVLTPMFAEKRPGFAEDQKLIDSLSPMGRFADPREIGEAAMWLLSGASSFANGSTLTVDAGYTAL